MTGSLEGSAPGDAADPFAAVRRMPQPSRLQRAIEDFSIGAAQWWIWSSMAWQDIRQKYRGSVLGPFWLTLSMAMMILMLGTLYSRLLNQDPDTYVPFLCLGLLFWTFISTVMTEGCNCFILAEPIIRQVKMPFSVHVYRTIYRNLIVLGHNAVVYLAVELYYRVPLGPGALMVLPGLALLVLNGIWLSLLLGMVAARFRDIAPVVASLVQIIFFVTPIFWNPASLGGQHAWLVTLNPIFAMVEIVRSPLLGQPAAPGAWPLALATTVLGSAAAFAFFTRFRARIPFWV
jgi:ABC-2 type transport system permease protein/lipopolysaccharide transport system permease protein